MKTISKELAEILLPAIEHALQNADPGPLTTELFGEQLLTQSYDPALRNNAMDEARARDTDKSNGSGRNCTWFLVWDYAEYPQFGREYIKSYYANYNNWKGVTDGN